MLFITFVYPNHLTVAVTYYNRAFCVYPMPKSGQFRPIMDNEQGAHAGVIYIPHPGYAIYRSAWAIVCYKWEGSPEPRRGNLQ